MPLGGFVELGDSVFRKFSAMEADEDRDIADRLKFGEIVDALFPGVPEARRRELASDATRAFWHSATSSYPLRRSARRALRDLKTAGLRMGVVSNHHDFESLTAHLEESGIDSYFEVVLASEREGVRKPNVVIFERSLRALGAKKEHAIFVGDSPRHDIVGARRAGLGTVLIDDGEQPEGWASYAAATGHEARPDFVIQDLSELRRILGLEGARGRRTAKKGGRLSR
jgi:HAD superfamily hydrolase (TIGR01549 family)